jgi:hypothetical protein
MITATELQLLACCEVEPHLLHTDAPWCYNTATYVFERDEMSVTFAIRPSYRDVRISARRGEQRVFEFSARGVLDVSVIDEHGVDAIEIAIAEGSWLRLQFRPAVEITQNYTADGRFEYPWSHP